MKRIAIFASGSGSNAENIHQFFVDRQDVTVSLIVTNKVDAFVHQRASKLKIPVLTITRSMFYNSDDVMDVLQALKIDLIVLAGFLWLVPENLITSFPNKVINVHPALLPKFGGKGMYGARVHEAVVANKEVESGITIHYVNEQYDEGNIIRQISCTIEEKDTAEDVAEKIHALEYKYFPLVIEQILSN